jgi:hypothetical protein
MVSHTQGGGVTYTRSGFVGTRDAAAPREDEYAKEDNVNTAESNPNDQLDEGFGTDRRDMVIGSVKFYQFHSA